MTAPKRRLAAGDAQLLELLWQRGPLTLQQVHQSLSHLGYTTVQTRLNRLAAKGLARRGDERPARYEAAIPREDVQARELTWLVERFTQGQVIPLVAELVRDRRLSPAEIDELRRLIDEAEKNAKTPNPKRGRS